MVYNIDIKKYINENTVTEIKGNSKLFFTKSSNFPRFKLSDTTFSKCIKLEKADYVVIGKDGEGQKTEEDSAYGKKILGILNEELAAIKSKMQELAT